MKKLTICSLALIFALGSALATAAPSHGDRHHKRHDKVKQHSQKHYKVGRHHDVARIPHSPRKHRKHIKHHRKHEAAKHHRRQHRRHHRKHNAWRYDRGHRYGWHHNRHFGRHYNHGHGRHYRSHYFPGYLGAAIVGSVLTHSLYHTHNGAVCYDNNDDRRDRDYRDSGNGEYTEVVGCHRIERLDDGLERRVEVPLSECR